MTSHPPIGMLPDDVFRARLRAVQAHLAQWASSVDEIARIETLEADTYWLLRAAPDAAHACPLEIIVHDNQHFDLQVGPETYERCPVGDVNLIARIVEAVAAGRVTTRTHASRHTGAVRSVETIITLENGGEWRGKRCNQPLATAIAAEACEARDQHYVPYRRT